MAILLCYVSQLSLTIIQKFSQKKKQELIIHFGVHCAASSMEDKLQAIAAKRRNDVIQLLKLTSLEALRTNAAKQVDPRNLLKTLETCHKAGLMCMATEFKRASPSKGPINTDVSLQGKS